jgi:hypothetical protein
VERSLRPSRGYRLRELPPELARRLQEVLGLPWAPATLGEMVDSRAARPRQVSPADLCCQGSRHQVTVGGETSNTRCVVDALVLAAAGKEGGLVESLSPLLGQKVVVRIAPDGVAVVSPPAAVFSYGVAREGGQVYEAFCPYLLAFASEDEYRRWAEATPEALTVMLSPEEAVSLARDLAVSLLGGVRE